jgi:hypothetical protein
MIFCFRNGNALEVLAWFPNEICQLDFNVKFVGLINECPPTHSVLVDMAERPNNWGTRNHNARNPAWKSTWWAEPEIMHYEYNGEEAIGESYIFTGGAWDECVLVACWKGARRQLIEGYHCMRGGSTHHSGVQEISKVADGKWQMQSSIFLLQ